MNQTKSCSHSIIQSCQVGLRQQNSPVKFFFVNNQRFHVFCRFFFFFFFLLCFGWDSSQNENFGTPTVAVQSFLSPKPSMPKACIILGLSFWMWRFSIYLLWWYLTQKSFVSYITKSNYPSSSGYCSNMFYSEIMTNSKNVKKKLFCCYWCFSKVTES